MESEAIYILKVILTKCRVIPLFILVPIASIFEMTGQSYGKKVREHYKGLIDILRM